MRYVRNRMREPDLFRQMLGDVTSKQSMSGVATTSTFVWARNRDLYSPVVVGDILKTGGILRYR